MINCSQRVPLNTISISGREHGQMDKLPLCDEIYVCFEEFYKRYSKALEKATAIN